MCPACPIEQMQEGAASDVELSQASLWQAANATPGA